MQHDSRENSQHPVETPLDADAELSGLRIRQISTLRRAAVRSRSYCIIGAAVCVVGAIQLIVMMVKLPRFHDTKHWAMMGGEALLALGALWGCFELIRRGLALHRELQKTMLEEPTQPPDFSTLSDGSQQVQALEQMMAEPPQEQGDNYLEDRE